MVNEQLLIKGAKDNFHLQTGKWVKIVACNQWESKANFTYKASINEVLSMVFDATGWTYGETFGCDAINVNGKMVTSPRSHNRVMRRALIDYICINNGVFITSMGKETGRDHTTVIASVRNFENALETEPYYRQLANEVINYCIDNYQEYTEEESNKLVKQLID